VISHLVINDDLEINVGSFVRHLKKGRCPGLKIYDQSELPVAGIEQTILGEGEMHKFVNLFR
jgi:hypothetical protein